jgi:RNA polymerase sigma factor (sigma-70 family)
MTGAGDGVERLHTAQASFATTHWSVVLAASDPGAPHAAEAIDRLCRTYWFPLYTYARRWGCDPEEAQDLTQEFFARILAREYLAKADPQKGRFRSYLLTGLKNLICDERDKAGRLKRGGGRKVISFDEQDAEGRYRLEAADNMTPERIFERTWTMTLLAQAVARLRDEYVASGKAELYEQLTEFRLDGPGQRAYAEVAAQLGLSESAVKSAIHRLRQRHHELVREEIAQTVAEPAEVDEEIRHLLEVMAWPAGTELR